MAKILRLPSDLARLERESDMLDTIVTMMGAERLDGLSNNGVRRRDVVDQLAGSGLELATAVGRALGDDATVDGEVPDDTVHRYRTSVTAFAAVAERLDELDETTTIEHHGHSLRPAEVVPQRIAEVILANDTISSIWTLDEADPDSVLDALDAMVRRLQARDDVPAQTITTLEGDEWLVHGGGDKVYGTREFVAAWLAHGDSTGELQRVPQWT